MRPNKLSPRYLSSIAISAIALGVAAPESMASPSASDSRHVIALELARVLRCARRVISQNQTLINDASKGNKGLTGKKVIAEATKLYRGMTGVALPKAEGSGLAPDARRAMANAIDEVMTDAQPKINKKGVGAKMFLPAIFAKKVAENFNAQMGERISMKLTAPKEYLRNPKNAPDSWEHQMIESRLKKASTYTYGQPVSEKSKHQGKDAFRLILPEYYYPSCLTCHGEPKGELDPTGGKKEGGKRGDLGGAISVVVFDSGA